MATKDASPGAAKDEKEGVDEAIFDRYGHYVPPNFERAERQHKQRCGHHVMFTLHRTNPEDLAEFGGGHMLYFYFLRYLGLLFFILAVAIGVPAALLFVFQGSFYNKPYGLAITTLGHYGPLFTNEFEDYGASNTTSEELIQQRFRYPEGEVDPPVEEGAPPASKAAVMRALAIADAVIFGCAWVVLVYSSTFFTCYLARQAQRDAITIATYSVDVTGLPDDAGLPEVKEFFQEHAGPVARLHLQQDCKELVRVGQARYKAKALLEEALSVMLKQAEAGVNPGIEGLAQLEALESQVRDLETQFKEEQASKRKLVAGFVTFRMVEAQGKCLDMFHQGSRLENYFRKPTVGSETPLFRGTMPLTTKRSLEPPDIIFEHLGISQLERFQRRLVTALGKYLMILAAFGIISLAVTAQTNILAVDSACDACGNLSDPGTAQKEAFLECKDLKGILPGSSTPCLGENPDTCYNCYCAKALTLSPLGETGYCEGIMWQYAYVQTINIGAAAVTAVINQVLYFTTLYSTSQEAHTCRSTSAASTVSSLFYAQFLNTVVVQIIASTRFKTLSDWLDNTFLQGWLFTGTMSDISPYWYKDVGQTMVLNLGIQLAIRVAMILIQRGLARWRLYRAPHCVTQDSLRQAFEGSVFILAPRYGELLNMLFLAIMFAGTIPVVVPLLCVGLAGTYKLELLELLRWAERPVQEGPALAQMALGMLPWAVVWHMAWCLWAFSYSYAEPDSLLGGVTLPLLPAHVNSRITQENAAPFLVSLFAIFITLFVRGNYVRLGLSGVVDAISNKLSPPDEEEEEETSFAVPSYQVALQSKLLQGPSSYALGSNPYYADACSTKHWNPAVRLKQRSKATGADPQAPPSVFDEPAAEEGGDAEAHPADSDGIIDISAAGTEADAVAGKPLEVTSSKVPEAWVPSDSPPGTASSSLGPRRVSVAASITASQAGDGKRPSLATVKEEGGSSSRLGGTAAAPDSAEIARTSGEAAESMVLEVNNAKRDKAKKQRKERRRSSKVAPAEADGRKSDSLALNIGQLLEDGSAEEASLFPQPDAHRRPSVHKPDPLASQGTDGGAPSTSRGALKGKRAKGTRSSDVDMTWEKAGQQLHEDDLFAS